jgi:hypothetical protein
MTIDEAIEVLELHNKWRKGADIEMQSPVKIGMAIDLVVCELKTLRERQSLLDIKDKDEWISREVIEYDWNNEGFGDESIKELLSKGYERGYNDALKSIEEAIKMLKDIAEGLYPSTAEEAFIFVDIAKKMANEVIEKALK